MQEGAAAPEKNYYFSSPLESMMECQMKKPFCSTVLDLVKSFRVFN